MLSRPTSSATLATFRYSSIGVVESMQTPIPLLLRMDGPRWCSASRDASDRVQRIDGPRDLAEPQRRVVRRAHAGTGALDDRLREPREASTVMHAALEHQVTLARRVDADRLQACEVVRFLLAADHNDLDATGVEDDGPP